MTSTVRSESPLVVFVSSIMRDEVNWARDIAFRHLEADPIFHPWVFENTPASSAPPDDTYIEKVRTSDIVVWLVAKETTPPVVREIREAIARNRRLLVFKLPSDERDPETLALMAEVGRTAKYVELPTRDAFAGALADSLEDELTRAFRSGTSRTRSRDLSLLLRASQGRCIAKWQAARVPLAKAKSMVDDVSLGALPASLAPSADRPFVLLLGEIGGGKSLAAERHIQDAIRAAQENTLAPIPVYIAGSRLGDGSLRDVALAVAGDGSPIVGQQGACLVLDDVDALSTRRLSELIIEARQLVHTWPHTTVLVAARGSHDLNALEETKRLPRLDLPSACDLISSHCDSEITEFQARQWPEEVRDAICLPLFALLMAMHLRRDNRSSPRSRGELIAELVTGALEPLSEQAQSSFGILSRLACLVTSRGGPVPSAEVANRDAVERVLASCLVEQRDGALGFPLAIVCEWLAAQSLLDGQPHVEELLDDPQLLERWRAAITVAVATGGHEPVTALLIPVARAHVGYAATAVVGGFARHSQSASVGHPPSLEAAARMRVAMQAWIDGLGPIARLICPVHSDGQVLPLAVHTSRQWLTEAWHKDSGRRPPEAVLPAHIDLLNDVDDDQWWGVFQRQTSRQSAWAWQATLSTVVQRLGFLLSDRRIPWQSDVLEHEALWNAVVGVMRIAKCGRQPVAVSDLLAQLEHLPDRTSLSTRQGDVDVDNLRELSQTLLDQGLTVITPPWPGPDRDESCRGIWDPFSNAQIAHRTELICEAALREYGRIIDDWFGPLKVTMTNAATLPARFVGKLCLASSSGHSAPAMRWYLEPLDSECTSESKITLVEEMGTYSAGIDELHALYARLALLRPNAVPWIHATFHTGRIDHILEATPVTDLIYKWLKSDLEWLLKWRPL